jgi:hypothetical protein
MVERVLPVVIVRSNKEGEWYACVKVRRTGNMSPVLNGLLLVRGCSSEAEARALGKDVLKEIINQLTK